MYEDGNFRHCTGENIQVYTAYGSDSFEAVRYLMKGLRKIGKKSAYNPSIASITVQYEEGLGRENDCYVATAYIYGVI
jgi:hypothetical protein